MSKHWAVELWGDVLEPEIHRLELLVGQAFHVLKHLI